MSQPLFCIGKPEETDLFKAIEARILTRFPDTAVKHDRTQTAFVRKVQFTWVSLPRRKADAGAVMLSIGLPAPLESPRIRHCAETAPGRWMHHIIVKSADELDEELCSWIGAAWTLLGPGRR
ncbi:MAG: hypothetical protein IJ343_00730 [Clostridia bacterium]|nr:hypothetical protein [Clostridia bacterium]